MRCLSSKIARTERNGSGDAGPEMNNICVPARARSTSIWTSAQRTCKCRVKPHTIGPVIRNRKTYQHDMLCVYLGHVCVCMYVVNQIPSPIPNRRCDAAICRARWIYDAWRMYAICAVCKFREILCCTRKDTQHDGTLTCCWEGATAESIATTVGVGGWWADWHARVEPLLARSATPFLRRS